MDLLLLKRDVRRDVEDVRFHGVHKNRIELGDKVVVALLAIGVREGIPRESVNVPCVIEVDVAEAQGYGTARLGECCDEHVGAE